jgi:3-dehydroquinate dehydratase II
MDMKKICVINGPNLNMLGKREEDIYGKISLKEIEKKLKECARSNSLKIEFYQSNSESGIIEKLHSIKKDPDAKGLIINAAAFTHTSIAIMDALKMLSIPVIEVHLSNIFRREEFRRVSYVSLASSGVITGLGIDSYLLALEHLARIV